MKNELYHSDIYLGEDYSDGIQHFKYIKREMKNGKWVYYYKDAEYDKAKKNYSKTKDAYNRESEAYKNTKHYKDRAYEAFKKSRNPYGDQSKNKDDAWAYAENTYLSKQQLKKKEAAKKKYDAATKKYKKVKIKSIPRRAIAKGIVATANTVSSLSAKVKKQIKKKLKIK